MTLFAVFYLVAAILFLSTQGCFAISDDIEWTSFGSRELSHPNDFSSPAQIHLENYLRNETSFQPPNPTKGASSPSESASERIVKGVNANHEDYRYFARLTYVMRGQLFYLCGGVLISDRFILTAAHCVWNMANGGIFPGGLRPSAYGAAVGYVCDYPDNCGQRYVTYRATDYWVHPQWDSSRLVLDIGLIRLEHPVPSDVAVPAAPDLGDFYRSLAPGYISEIQTVGYGKIDDAGRRPQELQSLQLGYLTPEQCRRYWGHLSNGVLCVYTNDHQEGLFGRGLCGGDSGSPSVLHRIDGPDVVIGVTSFGYGLCTEKTRPDILARVSAAAPFIANIVCYPGMSNVAPDWCLRMGWGAGAQDPVDIDAYDAGSVLGSSFGNGFGSAYGYRTRVFSDEIFDFVQPENKIGQDMVFCQENDDTTYLPNLLRPDKEKKCGNLKTKGDEKLEKFCTRMGDTRSGTVSNANEKCCNTCQPYQRLIQTPFSA